NDSVKSVGGVPFTASENVLSTTQPPYRLFVPAKEITKDISYTREIRDSVAKTDQVRVLDKSRLEKKIGRLTTAIISVGLGWRICSISVSLQHPNTMRAKNRSCT